MRLSILSVFALVAIVLAAIVFGPTGESLAATVSCEVKEVNGSTLVLVNCDERLAKDFKKGRKVKVRLQKKEN